ncbi:MAG: hypothetical protein AB1758_16840, partial [Candidatus Eremiobacterota bacterium]
MQEQNEEDPGFKSGPWTGFYTMPGPGTLTPRSGFHRQSMVLTFKRSRMTGEGLDDVGRFLISGGYDLESRRAWWNKTYVGAHTVH